MKSIPLYLILIVVAAISILFLTYYQFNDTQDNHRTSLVNETMRSALFSSIDPGKTRVSEELFIDKVKFEESSIKAITEALPNSLVKFDYLLLSSGAVKAVKMTVTESSGDTFTSTYKVNESIQGG